MRGGECSRLGLDDLLENDQTSYEYFHALPKEIQRRVAMRDVGSFEELNRYVAQLRQLAR